MSTYEEWVGVRLPEGKRYITRIPINIKDSDEEILGRISKKVGTIFDFGGLRYEVTSSAPFILKDLTEIPAGETFAQYAERIEPKVLVSDSPPQPDEVPPQLEQLEATPEPSPNEEAPSPVFIEPETLSPVPESEAPKTKGLPQVGETWKAKDSRRPGTFEITTVYSDHVITDKGLKINLNRIQRYQRVEIQKV